eukprot:TRINITY_DN1058_c0_g1_i1.p1 TRINITY_DN1058_c0_g1~~TRINITY_DN1058_c0_g1_i1.p1  ORF type:complete len:868 (-),score=148.65 TRINITY_DN1058_c0_g1_i1:385-2988(-)
MQVLLLHHRHQIQIRIQIQPLPKIHDQPLLQEDAQSSIHQTMAASISRHLPSRVGDKDARQEKTKQSTKANYNSSSALAMEWCIHLPTLGYAPEKDVGNKMSVIRSLVSKKKRRYQENGFDLDLSYITDRMIAMGFPSEKLEGIYRNPREEVFRFLETMHKDHYKIYNLCSERQYDPAKFHNRVARFPFDDHNPPPFQLIREFCLDVESYLSQHENNVAVVHCKAGKGRTGMMICSWLLHTKQWETAKDALAFFADSRTADNKGVTIPSQRRYVQYYEQYLREGPKPNRPFEVRLIRLHTLPNFDSKGLCDPWFQVTCRGEKIYSSKGITTPIFDVQAETIEFKVEGLVIQGDVKFEFFHQDTFTSDEMFHFWICSAFLDGKPLYFVKESLDKAVKDKSNRVFKANFQLELIAAPIDHIKAQEYQLLSRSQVRSSVKSPLRDVFRSEKSSRNSRQDVNDSLKNSRVEEAQNLGDAIRLCKEILLTEKPTSPTLSLVDQMRLDELIASMDESHMRVRVRLKAASESSVLEVKREFENWPSSFVHSSSMSDFNVMEIEGKLRDIISRVRKHRSFHAARVGSALCSFVFQALTNFSATLSSTSRTHTSTRITDEERSYVDALRAAVQDCFTMLWPVLDAPELKGLYLSDQTSLLKKWIRLLLTLTKETRDYLWFDNELAHLDLTPLEDFVFWDFESRLHQSGSVSLEDTPTLLSSLAATALNLTIVRGDSDGESDGSSNGNSKQKGSAKEGGVSLPRVSVGEDRELHGGEASGNAAHAEQVVEEDEEDEDDDDDMGYVDTSASKSHIIDIHRRARQVHDRLLQMLEAARREIEQSEIALQSALEIARFVRKVDKIAESQRSSPTLPTPAA